MSGAEMGKLSAELRRQAMAPALNIRLNAAPLQDKAGRVLASIVVEGEAANNALPNDSGSQDARLVET
ncbi:hypothetical protein [Bradyrhizobium liaoningense]|uniref:hypothetical protein n=1 Tax=Bradyrhizobium liaoningense TaxID=43992 RepID=UPI0004B390D5|nr:hypothetical protein [Bradyrhizobium liaoningense]